VKEEYYETVGEVLLWTLEQGLGKDFTPDVKEAWAEAYKLLSDTMKSATREACQV
jgi:hemoglobin-like flavoprotein